MRKNRRHRRKANAEVNLGFQIAPMIDVVFVILLFFIVQASDIQVENAHVTKLPGTVELKPGIVTPDEIAELEAYGVERIYHPNDGMQMGLVAMIEDLVSRTIGTRGGKPASAPNGNAEVVLGKLLTAIEQERQG